MTKHVGIFEAKTRLSSLVDEVEKGGEIAITRHGKPVAKLIAHQEPDAKLVEQRRQAIADIRKRASQIARDRGTRLSIKEIKAWNERRL